MPSKRIAGTTDEAIRKRLEIENGILPQVKGVKTKEQVLQDVIFDMLCEIRIDDKERLDKIILQWFDDNFMLSGIVGEIAENLHFYDNLIDLEELKERSGIIE